jgi:Zn-dependent protease
LPATALTAAAWAVAPPLTAAAQFQGLHKPTPLGVALVIAFLVISLGIHEAAHGWVAWKCGDPTAKDLGRISLNPIVHIDPLMTILLPAILFYTTGFIFGGAKPVPVAMSRLRHPLRDMSLVALAGPGSNLLLAILFAVAWKLSLFRGAYAPDQLLPQVLAWSMVMNVVLAVFNLVPIPPLDGSRVMTWLLPPSLRAPYVSLERFGMILIFVLIFWVPAFRVLLWDGIFTVVQLVHWVTGEQWR